MVRLWDSSARALLWRQRLYKYLTDFLRSSSRDLRIWRRCNVQKWGRKKARLSELQGCQKPRGMLIAPSGIVCSSLRSPYQLSEIHMSRDAFMGYWSTPQGHGLRSMTEIWVMVRFPRQPTRWIQKSMDYDRVWVLPMMGYDRVDCSLQHSVSVVSLCRVWFASRIEFEGGMREIHAV